jgi:hypothetical protein
MQLEGLVEEKGPQGCECVHRHQKFQQVGCAARVNLRDSKATEWKAPASSYCSRKAETVTANSEASVSRSVERAGSHTRSTGAEVIAALRRQGCRGPFRGRPVPRSAIRTCSSIGLGQRSEAVGEYVSVRLGSSPLRHNVKTQLF